MTSRSMMAAVILFIFFVSISCAPGNARFDRKPAGFFAGLWHGLICIITFIIGIFSDNVRMYEINNSGSWYDLGFLIGASMVLGGGGAGSRRRKRR